MASKDGPKEGPNSPPPPVPTGKLVSKLLKSKILAVVILGSLLLSVPLSHAHRIQRKRQTQDPPMQPPQVVTNSPEVQNEAQPPGDGQEPQYADQAPAEGDPSQPAPQTDQSKQEERAPDPNGAEIEGSYEAEKQALEFAKNKNLPMVMRLVPKMTKFDYDDGTSEGTLLHYAAFHGWTNLMDILVKEKQVSPTMENQYDKRTPLLSACRGGRLDSVKYCIKSLKKNDWSASNENGLTCSHFAAREGHPEILSYMIELNKLADIPLSAQSHKSDKKLQWTPLHYAANNGHTECAIILLLEAGANPYKRGFRMQSAIDLARARGDKMLVDIMHDPLKFKITNLLEASLGLERKAREKAITALREDILKLKEALHSAGPEGEHAGVPGSAPAMIPNQAAVPSLPPQGLPGPPMMRLKRSVQMFDQTSPMQAPVPVDRNPVPVVQKRANMENFHGHGSAGMFRTTNGGPIKREVGAASGMEVSGGNVSSNGTSMVANNSISGNATVVSTSQQSNGPQGETQNQQPQDTATSNGQTNDSAASQPQQVATNNDAISDSNQVTGKIALPGEPTGSNSSPASQDQQPQQNTNNGANV